MTTAQKRIALAIKAKRRASYLGVRDAAKECGISAATLSRLERGAFSNLPDATTLTKLAGWLHTSVSELLQEEELLMKGLTPQSTVPEIVEVHLRADKNLSPKTAKALSDMFRALYEQASGLATDSAS